MVGAQPANVGRRRGDRAELSHDGLDLSNVADRFVERLAAGRGAAAAVDRQHYPGDVLRGCETFEHL